MKMTMQFGARAHQRIGDFQSLLAGVRLRDQEIFKIDAELAGIDRIQRMFGIDEGADATLLLGFGNGLQRQCRLAGAFRSIDFDHAPLGQSTDSQRDIEAERSRRNGFDFDNAVFSTELHDRSLAERAFDLGECRFKCLAFIHRFVLYKPQRVLCHVIHL